MDADPKSPIQQVTLPAFHAAAGSPFQRRTSKCAECPYKNAKPSQRSREELAYARCTPPKDFHCHMGHERENWSGSYGYGDGETMCRGHWEMYHAAVKRGIAADESAGDRVFRDDPQCSTERFVQQSFPDYGIKVKATTIDGDTGVWSHGQYGWYREGEWGEREYPHDYIASWESLLNAESIHPETKP